MTVEPYGADRLDIFRAHFAPDATNAELELFAKVCERLDLDPFAEQIVLIGRWDSRVNRVVHRHQVTVAGRRAIAARTGRLVRVDGPVWCAPRNPPKVGPLVWDDVWTGENNDPPYAARVLIYTPESGDQPAANGTAKWSEFAQYTTTKRDQLSPLWRRMPSHMLGKVAESMALRRAFPEVDRVIGDAAIAGGHSIRPVDEIDADTGEITSTVDEAEATPDARPTNPDRVPDHVYDDAPEAQRSLPDQAYRYDPADAEPY